MGKKKKPKHKVRATLCFEGEDKQFVIDIMEHATS